MKEFLNKYVEPPDKWFSFPQFESPTAGITHIFFIAIMYCHFNCPAYQKYWIFGLIGWLVIKAFHIDDGEASKD